MKRRIIKKLVSGALLFALVAGSIPVNLYADDSEESVSSESGSDSYTTEQPSGEDNTLEVSITITPNDGSNGDSSPINIVGEPIVGVTDGNEASIVSFVPSDSPSNAMSSEDEDGNESGDESGAEDENVTGDEAGAEDENVTGNEVSAEDENGTEDEAGPEDGDVTEDVIGDEAGAGYDSEASIESSVPSASPSNGKPAGDEEGDDTGDEDGDETGDDSGDSEVRNPVYNQEDIKHDSEKEIGPQNYYEITFKSDEEDDESQYTIYVAGIGVNKDVCEELMKNFLNGSAAPVINQNLIDTDKNSMYLYDEDGKLERIDYVSNINGDESISTTIEIGEGESAEVYYDSNLCWAMTASSVVYQTNWMQYADAGIFNTLLEGYEDSETAIGYFQSSDDIADYARYCWENTGNYIYDFYEWLFSGDALDSEDPTIVRTRFGYDANDALLSGYQTGFNFGYKDDLGNRLDAQKDYMVNKMEAEAYANNSKYLNYYGIMNWELLNDDILKVINYSQEHTLYSVFGDVPHMGGMSIRFGEGDGSGAHAITYNGYVTDQNGKIVAVIITDPDDSISEEPNLGRYKNNQYKLQAIDTRKIWYQRGEDGTVTRIPSDQLPENIEELAAEENSSYEFIEKYYIDGFDVKSDTDTFIYGIDYLPLVIPEDKTMSASYDINYKIKYPTVQSAISASNVFNSEYSTNEDIEVALNFDFLEFYDIDKLKLTIKDSQGNDIRSDYLQYSKEYWKECIAQDLTTLKINLGSIEGEAGTSYSAQLSIDSSCFYGNYGWFAERSNYSEELMGVLVKIAGLDPDDSDILPGGDDITNPSDGTQPGSTGGSDNTDKADIEGAGNGEDTGKTEEIIGSIPDDDTVLYYRVSGDEASRIVLSATTEEEKAYTISDVSHDVFNAIAGDMSLTQKLATAGIDVANINVTTLDMVYSSKVLSGNAGLLVMNTKKLAFGVGDTLFAAVRLSNGKLVYVRVTILPNGKLVIQLPDNAVSVSIFKASIAL